MDDHTVRALKIFSEGVSGSATSHVFQCNPQLTGLQKSELMMHSFDRALKIFGDGLQRLRSAKAHHHNTHLPISHLPNELLVKIFALASEVEDPHTTLDYRRFYTPRDRKTRTRPAQAELVIVCHDWRRLMLQTPSLWVHIRSDHPRRAYLEFSARSGDIPLHIYLDENDLSNPTARQYFKQMICQDVHRWQSVKMYVTSMEFMGELKQLAAPTLEKLVVRGDDLENSRGVKNLFCGGTKKLRHLILHNISISWGSNLFSCLTMLSI
ncbi:hypothetical protein FRB95_002556 [Tulasnella sp. JGI-2019a]|nr:hypothetical protein FRB95_002556 [Tulasnella sp. JGI-2019a]